MRAGSDQDVHFPPALIHPQVTEIGRREIERPLVRFRPQAGGERGKAIHPVQQIQGVHSQHQPGNGRRDPQQAHVHAVTEKGELSDIAARDHHGQRRDDLPDEFPPGRHVVKIVVFLINDGKGIIININNINIV